jgi:hypothetical protein
MHTFLKAVEAFLLQRARNPPFPPPLEKKE